MFGKQLLGQPTSLNEGGLIINMKIKLTVEKLLTIAAVIFAFVILFASRDMKFIAAYSIGPAALPVVCALLLCVFAAFVWLTSTEKIFITLGSLISHKVKRAYLLIALIVAFITSIYFVGIWIPLLIYSILSFVLIEQHSWLKSVGMGIAWVTFLYVVFVLLLNINIPLIL